jgi:hypothetical protein
MLTNKKILFIGPVFHDYHLLITNKLKSMGAEVIFCPERNYGPVFKIINNFLNSRLAGYQVSHYQKIIDRVKFEKIDYLFVIRGYMMPTDFLENFRQINPDAKLIMYQWDSNNTNPYSHLLKYFDKTYSFDFEDCKKFNRLNYLPLFYSDDVGELVKAPENLEFDFFFMGWHMPERYKAVLKFKEYAEKNGFKIKAFLYMPVTSYIKEYLKGNKLDLTVISLKHMPRTEYLDILNKTRIMVDASSNSQTGLAMRVIEALAAKTKILTNNLRIKDDVKIYNNDYVSFFDEKNPFVEQAFLYAAPTFNIENLLSLEGWLIDIFDAGKTSDNQ